MSNLSGVTALTDHPPLAGSSKQMRSAQREIGIKSTATNVRQLWRSRAIERRTWNEDSIELSAVFAGRSGPACVRPLPGLMGYCARTLNHDGSHQASGWIMPWVEILNKCRRDAKHESPSAYSGSSLCGLNASMSSMVSMVGLSGPVEFRRWL
eukprot:890699-Prymnesium_polylepis.1